MDRESRIFFTQLFMMMVIALTIYLAGISVANEWVHTHPLQSGAGAPRGR